MMGRMSRKDRSWYPWVSAIVYGVLVFALLLVNTGGNLLVAVAVGLGVALLSWRIDRARQDRGA